MGQLKDLLVTGISHAMDNSSQGRNDSTPPTGNYNAFRYERSPIRSYHLDSRGIPQAYYDQGYNHHGSSNRDTRRSRRRDQKDNRRGQKGPTLIGSMRDMLTSHMPQGQNESAMRNQGALRRVVPAGYSNNTTGMQAALPASRVRPYFSQQEGQYTNQGRPLSLQSQRTVSEEDNRGDYLGNGNGSGDPYYADELGSQDRRANDLPPQYEEEDWNSRYESRAISAPPILSPREKQEY